MRLRECRAAGRAGEERRQLWLILTSTGVLAAVGVLAALIPTGRACRVSPIEALRYE